MPPSPPISKADDRTPFPRDDDAFVDDKRDAHSADDNAGEQRDRARRRRAVSACEAAPWDVRAPNSARRSKNQQQSE